MRNRILLAAALVLLPFHALATVTLENGGRVLASGKLDASNSYDFSCSVVNKTENDDKSKKVSCDSSCEPDPIDVTITLKDEDGEIYINPQTFLPATLDATLEFGEAAMLTAPANFVGVTSLYCWAEVPGDATVFGTFLTRDAQDRSTAAVPLRDNMRGGIGLVHAKMTEILEMGVTTNGPTKKKLPLFRTLASGKLDANASYDFSCSVVNKNEPARSTCPTSGLTSCLDEPPPGKHGAIGVLIALKDEDGNTYINPETFQPAAIDPNLEPGEAAMLTAPAGFGGPTSLYCWAQVPFSATVHGAFLTRDAQDRATAATPLEEDVHSLLHSVLHRLGHIHDMVQCLATTCPD